MTKTIETLPASKLVKSQVKTYGPKSYIEHGKTLRITATVRYDDECGNGHNSFSVTADIRGPHGYECGGCRHEDVAKHFPELAPFIKWHLTSADGPMHYLANALYWAGYSGFRDGKPTSPPNLEHLKTTILYGVLPGDGQFDLEDCIYSDARGFSWNEANANKLRDWLNTRVAGLMAAFKADVEKLGLKY